MEVSPTLYITKGRYPLRGGGHVRILDPPLQRFQGKAVGGTGVSLAKPACRAGTVGAPQRHSVVLALLFAVAFGDPRPGNSLSAHRWEGFVEAGLELR